MTDEVIEQESTPVVEEAKTVETPNDTEVKTEESTQTEPQKEERKFTQAELQKQIAKAEAIAERRALKAYAAKLEGMTKTQPVQEAKPSIDGKPTMAQFANVEDYVEAVADWKLQQREQSLQQQKEIEQRQSISSKVNDIYSKAEKVEGFDRDVFDSLPLPDAAAWTIMESDKPELIMAHLVKNPDLAERIASLSPARQAAEIGKLEDKLSTAKEVKANVSKAPEPIKPIGQQGSATKDPADMTDSEFAQWRKRQIAQRR